MGDRRNSFALLAWLLLAGFVAHQIGLAELAESVMSSEHDSEGCEEGCPGDAQDGECPPGCDACTCCPASVYVLTTELARSSLSSTARVILPSPADGNPAGTSNEIFRPPRSASA